jgi:acetyltransferase-like isoleucine patch superfamily enzyme
MIGLIKNKLAKYPNVKAFLKSPWNWFYAAYLTIKYVDKWKKFPAFVINGSVRLKISKIKDATLEINDKLVIEQWLFGDERIVISLSHKSKCVIQNEFVIGNGVRIFVAPDASLVIKGKENESRSGITANSIIMVYKSLEIGKDCIIAWDTFITDCDWHGIEGKSSIKETIIGDHVWVGVGAKILKGSVINNNSIVTTLSVVLAGSYQESSLISGNPAKIVKTNIAPWSREMLPKHISFEVN